MWTQTITRINDIHIGAVVNAASNAIWNGHAKCRIRCWISDDVVKGVERLFQMDQRITVYMQNEAGEESIYFSGYLFEGEIENNIEGYRLNIVLVDQTYCMDKDEKKRIFQDKAVTYREVIETVLKQYECTILSEKDLEQPIGKMIVQYHETDWEFLIRVASQIGAKIYGNYLSQESYLQIGEDNANVIELEGFDEHLIRKAASEVDVDLEKTIDEDFLLYSCSLRQKNLFGKKVIFKNSTWYIWEQSSKHVKGEIIFSYTLCRKNLLQPNKKYNMTLVGVALDAEVKNVANDQVQVLFTEDDLTKGDGYTWLPYSTVYSSPDGTGWYCMPEKGDSVRVFFPNEDEKNAYTISSVHQPKGAGSKRSDPDKKTISTKFGKIIELAPSTIKISNGDGMLLCISDEDGIIITSETDISLNADGNISLISSSDTIDICAAKSITLQQGENKILIEDEIIMEGTKFKVQ